MIRLATIAAPIINKGGFEVIDSFNVRTLWCLVSANAFIYTTYVICKALGKQILSKCKAQSKTASYVQW